jgi:phosphohistidine swiveling domain-containing protein
MNELKKHIFEQYETYEKVPIISYEHAFHSFTKNPYLNGKANGNFVILQHEIYEGWVEKESKNIIEDEKRIRTIIDDSLMFIEKNISSVTEFLSIKKLTTEIALEKLKWLNELCIELYYTYSFFTVELIKTQNPDLLKQLPEIRMQLSNFVTPLWGAYDKILDFIVEKEQTTRSKVDMLISSEIENILHGNNEILKQDELEKREFAMVLLDNKIEKFVGKNAEEVRVWLDEQNPTKNHLEEKKNTKMVEGMVASKGKVTGKVVVLRERDHKNYAQVLAGKKDFVLVTFMTRPEIVPHLKEACAIVTNEGGITCHAAIVSRELGVPCIVGTKHATEVFKDGDLVEVDAENGVVKVIG